MDDVDRKLLNLIQEDFPVTAAPFAGSRQGRARLNEGEKNMTEEKKHPKFVLVDGSNYLFRAFYAIRELSNSKGFRRTRSTASRPCS